MTWYQSNYSRTNLSSCQKFRLFRGLKGANLNCCRKLCISDSWLWSFCSRKSHLLAQEQLRGCNSGWLKVFYLIFKTIPIIFLYKIFFRISVTILSMTSSSQIPIMLPFLTKGSMTFHVWFQSSLNFIIIFFKLKKLL